MSIATESAVVSTTKLNAWQIHASKLRESTLQRFAVRTDVCGLYLIDGTPTTETLENGENQLRFVLQRHFQGTQVAGMHSQNAEWNCRWFAIDVDCKEWWPNIEEKAVRNLSYALTVADRLRKLGFHVIVESSNGIGGFHVWVLLDRYVSAAWAHHLLREIVKDAEDCGFGVFVDDKGVKQRDFPEVFPKQDRPSSSRVGNWLRFPGRHHRIKTHWSYMLDENGLPMTLEESVEAWLNLPESDGSLVPEYIPAPLPKPKRREVPANTTGVKGCRETAETLVEEMPWHELLTWHGWQDCGGNNWRRPGKPSGGHSAILNDVGLHVFSLAVDRLEADETYGKWRFYVCSQGFMMDGQGQVEAARKFLGHQKADELDKASRRAHAEKTERDAGTVNLSMLMSSSNVQEASEAWIVFNAIDEATLLDAGAAAIRAPKHGDEGKYDWSTLAGKTVHVVHCGNGAVGAVVAYVQKFAAGVDVSIRSLINKDESGTRTIQEWATGRQDLLSDLRAIPYVSSEWDIPAIEEQKRKSFAGEDASDLENFVDEQPDWAVEGLFTIDEPLLLLARSKCCKTLTLEDLAVAFGTGTPWMGSFEVKQRRKVLFITGESNRRRTSRDFAKALKKRDKKFSDLRGMVRIECRDFPVLPSEEDREAIRKDVIEGGFEVVIIDPLYRGMEGIDASQLNKMGSAIKSFQRACEPAMVILSHHVIKSVAKEYGNPPELEDGSGAGIAESFGQWWLVGRNSKYQWDGIHDLCVQFGGREGQGGGRRVVFNEREWTFDVENWHEYIDEASDERKKRADDAKREAEERKLHQARSKILKAMRAVRTPLSRSRIRDDAGLSGTTLGPAFSSLISEGVIVQRAYRDGANRIQPEGFILNEFVEEFDKNQITDDAGR